MAGWLSDDEPLGAAGGDGAASDSGSRYAPSCPSEPEEDDADYDKFASGDSDGASNGSDSSSDEDNIWW